MNIELNKILQNEANRKCVDCNTPFPKWVSVNNAVFLCSECAKYHKTLSPEISIIKSIETDNLSEEEINLLKIGGNERFLNLMSEYQVSQEDNKEFKYFFKLCEYYRMLLQCELNKNSNPEAYAQAIKIKPSQDIALELMDNLSSDYIADKKSKFKNALETVSNVFSDVGSKIQDTAHQYGIDEKIKMFGNYVSESIKNLNEKLPVVKEAGEKAVGYAKNAGNFVVEKGKEIYYSETIQNFTHKAEEQYISLKEKAMNAIGNSNSNNSQ